MIIKLQHITVRELVHGYEDREDNGVFGYGGALNIRPAYQREFIYKDKQQQAVIESIDAGMPLNVMYWADNGNGSFELMDGQQRTLSICRFIDGQFSINHRYYHNLDEREKNIILDYELLIYICEKGSHQEKLKWFETINIAGEKLTRQELRNAVYTGTYVTDAKRYFSRKGCPAHTIAEDFLRGSSIRQDYLETVLGWISKGKIEDYMATHQNNPDAQELWDYFEKVIDWVKKTFTTLRKEMKGINWGALYDEHKDQQKDPRILEAELQVLLMDDDVTKKSGIYQYVLEGDPKILSIRAFTPAMKSKAFTRQNGVCLSCKDTFKFPAMEGDHIDPWHLGGKTIDSNCQMLCKPCNRRKSGK